jgi:hypothetical protein
MGRDTTRVCSTCEFWWPPESVSVCGECRAHPPVATWDAIRDSSATFFPKTSSKCWCGEHSQKYYTAELG